MCAVGAVGAAEVAGGLGAASGVVALPDGASALPCSGGCARTGASTGISPCSHSSEWPVAAAIATRCSCGITLPAS